jgi:hypothetical protein
MGGEASVIRVAFYGEEADRDPAQPRHSSFWKCTGSRAKRATQRLCQKGSLTACAKVEVKLPIHLVLRLRHRVRLETLQDGAEFLLGPGQVLYGDFQRVVR